MPDEVIALYLTFPDEASAHAIAERLVDDRLVACVNVLPGATSHFRWEGRVVREAEVVAVAKTTRARLGDVVAAVQASHPHDVPCLVAYPAVGGLDAYLAWVRTETREP